MSPRRGHALPALALLLVTGCLAPGAGPAAPTPATSASPVSPSSGSKAAPPVAAGATRAQVLQAANERFDQGALREAIELYERVVNTPPSADEAPGQSAAVEGFARLRLTLAYASLGRDDAGLQELQALQARASDSAFARVAAQFWHAYGQTADVRAACANVGPEIATQLAPDLARIRELGVELAPAEVCHATG